MSEGGIERIGSTENNEVAAKQALRWIATLAKDVEIAAVYTLAIVEEAKARGMQLDMSKGPREDSDLINKFSHLVVALRDKINELDQVSPSDIDTKQIENRLRAMGYDEESIRHWQKIKHDKYS